jgi:hypothetical protein
MAQDGVSVLLILLEVLRRFSPTLNLIAECRHILSEPDEALHLLVLELAVFLFQLLQPGGVMRSDKLSQSRLVAGDLAERMIAADDRKRGGEMRLCLRVPGVTAVRTSKRL